jgi:hypothetical protein
MLASAQSKHVPSISGACSMNQTGATEKKTEKMQIDISHPRRTSITAASLQVWLRAKKGNGRGKGEMRQYKVWNSNLVITITRFESEKSVQKHGMGTSKALSAREASRHGQKVVWGKGHAGKE